MKETLKVLICVTGTLSGNRKEAKFLLEKTTTNECQNRTIFSSYQRYSVAIVAMVTGVFGWCEGNSMHSEILT